MTLFPKDAPSNSLQNHNKHFCIVSFEKKLNEGFPIYHKHFTFKYSWRPLNG